ncbi:hypothetical protein HID58_003099 [Brassica napus]|uniref:Uncharacterized protein n=1 Tax=Brassica napus TaxID=3708 RepID=A0ABQ8EQA7_BRANA|nr:hypothetical protein HID58_003099 [Brassica napus]
MASKALNNTANDSTEQITAISDLKPKHTTKMVHVKVLHSWSQNINHGGGGGGGGKPWNSYWLMRMGIKSMQAAKRLTLRVKEDFFWLEYGATSETSKSGLLEEHIAQQTISARFHLIKQQSCAGPSFGLWYAVETIQCAGGNQRKKLEFTLRDIKIPCCIWGKLTDTLHSACNQDDGLVTLLLRDTGDDKTLMPYESNEDSQEYIKK